MRKKKKAKKKKKKKKKKIRWFCGYRPEKWKGAIEELNGKDEEGAVNDIHTRAARAMKGFQAGLPGVFERCSHLGNRKGRSARIDGGGSKLLWQSL